MELVLLEVVLRHEVDLREGGVVRGVVGCVMRGVVRGVPVDLRGHSGWVREWVGVQVCA